MRKRKKECEKESVLGKYGMQKKKADTEKQVRGHEKKRVSGCRNGHEATTEGTMVLEKKHWHKKRCNGLRKGVGTTK